MRHYARGLAFAAKGNPPRHKAEHDRRLDQPRRHPAGNSRPASTLQRRCSKLAERHGRIAAAQGDHHPPSLAAYQEAMGDRGQPESSDEPPAWGISRSAWSSARSSWPRARPPRPGEAVPQRPSRTGRTTAGDSMDSPPVFGLREKDQRKPQRQKRSSRSSGRRPT